MKRGVGGFDGSDSDADEEGEQEMEEVEAEQEEDKHEEPKSEKAEEQPAGTDAPPQQDEDPKKLPVPANLAGTAAQQLNMQ